MKYAEQFSDWLVEAGYTHCFFVAGGNIMHLLDAARTRFECVPFVHEVGAGIAAEYFNEFRPANGGKAFVLVTAGPGLTNVTTAMAGAYLESRELLVVGGQVKSADLASATMRQRGIQEIDGIALVAPVCVAVLAIDTPTARGEVLAAVDMGATPRKGPVFIQMTLDAQGSQALPDLNSGSWTAGEFPEVAPDEGSIETVGKMLVTSQRPLLLVGGGVSREAFAGLTPALEEIGLPIATTWNGADRIGSDHPLYFGRPNTWGMRWSNVLIQQADLVVAVGTRLGMQQTGFNWQAFAPQARVVHVDIDPVELEKGHPRTDLRIAADGATFLGSLLSSLKTYTCFPELSSSWHPWRDFAATVRGLLPLADPENTHGEGYLDPFEFVIGLSDFLEPHDFIVPCSSGGAFTVAMQSLEQKSGQRIVTDKGLASMGYGLSGAIGAGLSDVGRRVILIEGDGGFSQNLQEIGTVAANRLPIKMFIFSNEGYASIRMTQRNYFDGAYVGCDKRTGLGIPEWSKLFDAYGVTAITLDPEKPFTDAVLTHLESCEPAAFIVPIDPEQTFYPKITSRVTEKGDMESNPLHLMTPQLPDPIASAVFQYIESDGGTQ